MTTTTHDPDRQAIATAARRTADQIAAAADELDRVHWQHAAGVIVTEGANRTLADAVDTLHQIARNLREVADTHHQEKTP